MKAMELLIIEAPVTGDYGTALQASTINLLVHTGETAKKIMDKLIIVRKNYLPQFAETIERLEAEKVTIKIKLSAI